MAGRGTDIKLGGAEESENLEKEMKVSKDSGGLYIIGTERHESRRIDNQLRGRSGRQGDPGSSKFFLSLEDDLMRIFGSEKLDSVLKTLGLADGESIQHPWITKALERAQKKVEARNFEIRKSLLRFDDVMNEQRKIIYDQRKEIINDKEIDTLVFDMRDASVDDLVDREISDLNELNPEKKKKIIDYCKQNLNVDLNFEKILSANPQIEDIKNEIIKMSDKNINLKKTQYSDELFAYAQKSILLQMIDKCWKEHLLSLDHLRQGISLRAYGQKDPLNEYKQEAFIMFEEMMEQIRFNITKIISFVEIKTESEQLSREPQEEINERKVPRNAKCPCGSGKKYKRCCGKI